MYDALRMETMVMLIRPRSALPRSDAVRVSILAALLITLLVSPRDAFGAFQSALPQPDLAPLASSFTVGDGTAASCTELALRSALAAAGASGGGRVHFDCGEAPATITLIQSDIDPNLGQRVSLTIPNRTTIDGGGLITLGFFPGFPGEHVDINVLVNPETKVRLKDLNLIMGFSGPGRATVLNLGTLSVNNSTFSGHPLGRGGIVNGGTLIVENSTFSSFWLSAISNSANANATVDHSAFIGNIAVNGTISNDGTLSVKNSIFSRNGSGDGGGAIANFGELTIDNCEFSHNDTDRVPGGAIANRGSLIVKHSTFFDNHAGMSSGGGIFETGGGTLTIKDCEFIDNVAAQRGGGIGIDTTGDTVVIERSTFSGNTAGVDGGGISGNGALTVSHSTITGNTAGVDGGGIYISSGTLTLKHSSVTGNTPNDISYSGAVASVP
jgi:predicted outer membrane repeat protein